jgi:hypothetical protein
MSNRLDFIYLERFKKNTCFGHAYAQNNNQTLHVSFFIMDDKKKHNKYFHGAFSANFTDDEICRRNSGIGLILTKPI